MHRCAWFDAYWRDAADRRALVVGHEVIIGRAAVRGSVRAVWWLLSLKSKSIGSDDLLGGMLLTGARWWWA